MNYLFGRINGQNGSSFSTETSLSGTQDGDIDSNNEIQQLSLSGGQLSISNGNNVDLSVINTDDQTLSLSGNQLSIANGNSVDLSIINTDTDDQTLTLSGNQLSIMDGNSVDLSGIDTDDQTLSLLGSQLSIADGNTVDIAGIDTDDQTLNLLGSQLSIADGNTVDLSGIDTDDQTLNLLGSQLSIADGNTVDLAGVDSDDQVIDKFNLNGNTLEISLQDDGQADQTVDLTGLKDNLGNHSAGQNLIMNNNKILDIDRIGVGTNNPLSFIEVADNSGGRTMMHLNNTFPSSPGNSIIGGVGPFLKINSGNISNFNLSGALIGMEIDLSNSTVSETYSAIFNGGKVGIGTSTPHHQLDLGDNLGRKLALYQNTGGSSFYGFGISGGTFELYAAAGAAAEPKMVVKGYTGNIGIGTINPDRTLHVQSDAGNTRFQAKTSGFSSFTDWLNHDGSVRGIVGVDGTSYSGNANEFAISTWTAHPLVFRANQSEQMRINPNGRIGIGTNNPTKGKVEINGGVGNAFSYGYLNGSGNTGSNSGSINNQYSLYASHRIAAEEFNAFSDMRIKNIDGISDSEDDLNTLMQIEITDYRLKDSISKGNKSIKKVIAQQVAEAYPQAVTKNLTEVVPDIYQRAEVKDEWIMLSTNLQVGDRVKLISETSNEIYEVIEAEGIRFKVKGLNPSLRSEDPSLRSGQVFVYGREVNDFHTVDYEALSMLNVSATQEQQKTIESQQSRIEALEDENAILQVKLKTLHDLEARMQALEALISPK